MSGLSRAETAKLCTYRFKSRRAHRDCPENKRFRCSGWRNYLPIPILMNPVTAQFCPISKRMSVGHPLDQGRRLDHCRGDPACLRGLNAAERKRLLMDWNRTQTRYARNSTVPELFEEQAKHRASVTALVYGDRRVSYDELNASSNQVAHRLMSFGLRWGSIVGVCMEPSPELLVAILGILKTGAAYAPLDPALPLQRLAWLLEDLSLSVIVCESNLQGKLLRSCASGVRTPQLLCLDCGWQMLQHESTRNTCCTVRSTETAYISFTSGSTGHPKGVCLSHRGIVRLVRNTNWARFQASDTFLQTAPIAFDASLLEIWGSLLNGARLVIPKGRPPSLCELASLTKEQHVTTAWFTSGLFNQIVEQAPQALTHLQLVVTGGDVASPPHFKRALDFLDQGRLVNGYGPTENCTFSTTYEVPPTFDGRSAVPIGCPIANSQCYVLDSAQNPVDIGEPGELYVGGDGLALGYLNRPELTAEKFISNPFESGARLYRTGDLARYRPDGNLEFLGRMDAQVKIRGYRVEPTEVESVLQQHPNVRACAVVGRVCAGGSKQLVAYIVPQDRKVESHDYREFLRARLPDYMVPFLYVMVGELPLSRNGKVDRKVLLELDVQPRPEQGREPQVCNHEVKSSQFRQGDLRRLWEEVLDVHPVGPNDNFFSLGGHSLLAMRLVERIRVELETELPVAAVFENPTLEQMSRLLCRGGQSRSNSALVEIQPGGARPPLFLVHGAGGGMFWGYSNLARHLGMDQPVLAFKSRGLDGLPELETIEALAEAYVSELRAFDSRGPYRLGGYCFGGLVAYEMARRLGPENIALLALINSHPPNSNYARLRYTPVNLARFALNVFVKSFYALPDTPQRWRALVCWKVRSWTKRIKRVLANRRAGPQEVDAEFWQDLKEYSPQECRLWQTHVNALTRYRPKPYGGGLALFRSPSHLLFSSFDRQYGWSQYVSGPVRVQIVPGAHDTVMHEPLVGRLASELRPLLAA